MTVPGPWIERNTWPDVEAAIAARMRGEQVVDGHAIDRYLAMPDAPRPGASALDCCSGVGQGALVLAAKGYQVDAFDVWRGPDQSGLAARGVSFHAMPFEGFVADGQYDLIAACECLEHLDSPAGALAKIAAWLKPDGRVFVTVPIEAERPENPFHKHRWSEAEAKALFRNWTILSERLDEGYILALELAPPRQEEFGPLAVGIDRRPRDAARAAWARAGLRPKVSCVCPTYGRVTTLGEALDSFLRQTWAPRELVILNDARTPITEVRGSGLRKVAGADCGGGHWSYGPGVDVIVHNAPLFPNLGHKYTALLELATGDVVAHWEDDDVWFPNHLEVNLWRLLGDPALECVKNQTAWVIERGGRESSGWRYAGTSLNAFESQMVFWRDAAREIGYSRSQQRQSYYLLEQFGARRTIAQESIHPWNTYCFRWDTRFAHGESIGVGGWTIDRWRESNRDFGNVLLRRPCEPYLALVLRDCDAATARPPLSFSQAAIVRGWLGRFVSRRSLAAGRGAHRARRSGAVEVSQ